MSLNKDGPTPFNGDPDTAVLRWMRASSAEISFRVFLSTTGTFNGTHIIYRTTGTSFPLGDLDPSTTYTFKIEVVAGTEKNSPPPEFRHGRLHHRRGGCS